MARPFPDAWVAILRENVGLYAHLSADEKSRVRNYVQIFVAEKNWEGCGGLTMTDEVRVTIAALVAIQALGFDREYFDRVLSILVYPDAYVAPGRTVAPGGIVLENDSARSGEAWYRGPVVLSWDDVLAGARRERLGRNVVFHEFAHQLDMLNGQVADGTPPLETREQFARWTEVTGAQYRQLVDRCHHGHRTLIDCYGATSPSEFFAVATETFFERPLAMSELHPALFDLFREFYRQDPRRFERED